MATEETFTPHVRWAQRASIIYLKFDIIDATNTKVSLKSNSLELSADGGNDRHYSITMEFFAEVKSEESTYHVQGRYIEMKIFKVEKVFWDRLLKESGKRHWLSVDWSKWKDEDDTDDEFSKMKFGNGSQTFNDFDFSDHLGGEEGGSSDDDDEMPDLEPGE